MLRTLLFEVQGLPEDEARRRAEAVRRWFGQSGDGAVWRVSRERDAGPLVGYEATGAGGERVWSTHAVVAALLAGLPLELEPAAVPQLVAFGYIADDRTQLKGVRPTWPVRDWSPVEDAATVAEAALLRALDERVPEGAQLGLTAGADSRVIALALAELGKRVATFTWGAPGSPDVDTAAHVAEALGLEHRALFEEGWHAPEEAIGIAREEARWHEGLSDFPLHGRPPWPEGITAYVTGGGGETGRAFYYRLMAASRPNPSLVQVARAWRPEDRLGDASAEAREIVVTAKREALEAAAATGHEGWAVLDVVYAQRRFVRWGRSMLPRTEFPLIGGFADAEAQRALASLPLEDKLTDGFHRRFVAKRRPELALPEPARQRAGVPPVVRRAAQRLRRRTPEPQRHELPSVIAEWIADDVLQRPELTGTMGRTWKPSTEAKLQLAQLAALEDALKAFSR